jgi:hypothetical protein
MAAGMSAEEARYAAMRMFGNATVAKEQTEETWGWTWLERLLQDVRFAMRQIRRAPGFSIIAILTLALGIGANNAVFTLTHGLAVEQTSGAGAGSAGEAGDRFKRRRPGGSAAHGDRRGGAHGAVERYRAVYGCL